ncbi:MAG: WbqC family protein [Bacteroides sp.]|nr:WbqC family protein [Bacteroides sp.]MBD5308614.1 WbqC family protein [Bacteroides sp.]
MAMGSPLMKYPDREIRLGVALCGNAGRYALIAENGKTRIACGARWNKRDKSIRRLDIADATGRLQLTVPINKPEHISGTSVCDLTVSGHGQWWNMTVTALESAYGRTPYFEFYIDRFLPYLGSAATGMRLTELCRKMDEEILDILGVDSEVTYDVECRETDNLAEPEIVYPQHRERELGFIGALSVLDLIFCHGPEAPRYFLKGRK